MLLFYYVRWIPRYKFSKPSFDRLFGYGSKILVASLITVVYDNIYGFIIGKKFSAASLGIYAKGDHFAAFAGDTTAGVLQRVAFPVLTDIQDDKPRLLSAYSRYIKMVAFFVFPLLMITRYFPWYMCASWAADWKSPASIPTNSAVPSPPSPSTRVCPWSRCSSFWDIPR